MSNRTEVVSLLQTPFAALGVNPKSKGQIEKELSSKDISPIAMTDPVSFVGIVSTVLGAGNLFANSKASTLSYITLIGGVVATGIEFFVKPNFDINKKEEKEKPSEVPKEETLSLPPPAQPITDLQEKINHVDELKKSILETKLTKDKEREAVTELLGILSYKTGIHTGLDKDEHLQLRRHILGLLCEIITKSKNTQTLKRTEAAILRLFKDNNDPLQNEARTALALLSKSNKPIIITWGMNSD